MRAAVAALDYAGPVDRPGRLSWRGGRRLGRDARSCPRADGGDPCLDAAHCGSCPPRSWPRRRWSVRRRWRRTTRIARHRLRALRGGRGVGRRHQAPRRPTSPRRSASRSKASSRRDYAALITAMETGQAQIAALPPFGLVQAVDRAGAEMILQSDRFGSTTYHTQFMTTDAATYCAEEPVANERQEGEEMVTRPELQRNRARLRRVARGTHRPRGARGGRAGHGRLIHRAGLGIGLHLPGHDLRHDGPRTPRRTSSPSSRAAMTPRSSPCARARPRSASASTTPEPTP